MPSFSYSNFMVNFIISEGKQQITFTAHRETANHYSPVLKAELKQANVRTQEYRIEDTTPRAFRLLLEWMYSQEIAARQLQNDHNMTKGEIEDEYMSFPEVWYLAARLKIPTLMDASLEVLHGLYKKLDLPELSIEYIYDNQHVDITLYKWLVRTNAQRTGMEPVNFPPEFLCDVINELKSQLTDHCHKDDCAIHQIDISEFFVDTSS